MEVLERPYVFLDIGCGKGKECLYWRKLNEARGGACESSFGIDYYEPLVKIATQNSVEMFGNKGDFQSIEATNYPYSKICTQLVAYMYNPFDETVMKRVIREMPKRTILIYTNPKHNRLILESGFTIISSWKGWHPNLNTGCYIKD